VISSLTRLCLCLALMGRPKKKAWRQPSVINTNLDNRYSPSANTSDKSSSDNDSDTARASPTPPLPPRTSNPRKRRAPPASQENTPHLITYIMSILTAAEMAKVASKRITKTISFSLATDEPWDTMKAQLLAKICSKINPPTIDFSTTTSCSSSRVLS
jgi:hypothetical protein